MSKQAILLTVYGTNDKEVFDSTIAPFVTDMRAAYPDAEVRIAFTSERYIKRAAECGFGNFDSVTGAVERFIADGYRDLTVQSTGVLSGGENEAMVKSLAPYMDKFDNVRLGKPLLDNEEDFCRLVKAIVSDLKPVAEELGGKDAALLLMGHGSLGLCNGAYSELGLRIRYAGYSNIFVTTLEQFPSVHHTEKDIAHCGFRKIVLAPLLMSRGLHTTRDMAGDGENSLKNILISKGYEVICVPKGLSEYAGFRKIIVEHAGSAVKLE